MKSITLLAVIALVGALDLSSAHAQAVPKSDIPPSTLKTISTPDKLDTPIGKLTFSDGVPTGDTVKILYDNLDRTRGLTVYLDNVGAVAIRAFLSSLAAQGADAPNKVAIFEQLMDSQAVVLTANTSTLYAFSRTDLANDGPTVIEIPRGCLAFSTMIGSVSSEILALPAQIKAKAVNISFCLRATTAKFPMDISC